MIALPPSSYTSRVYGCGDENNNDNDNDDNDRVEIIETHESVDPAVVYYNNADAHYNNNNGVQMICNIDEKVPIIERLSSVRLPREGSNLSP